MPLLPEKVPYRARARKCVTNNEPPIVAIGEFFKNTIDKIE
jgi:hypothetical protein